jgi:hypothetical protein
MYIYVNILDLWYKSDVLGTSLLLGVFSQWPYRVVGAINISSTSIQDTQELHQTLIQYLQQLQAFQFLPSAKFIKIELEK